MLPKHKKSNSAFTLIELMVTILILAILLAIAIPIFRGQINKAKWSEGKAIAGTIATALRAYSAEKNSYGTYGTDLPDLSAMGFSTSDVSGSYFNAGGYKWQTSYILTRNPHLAFTIEITAPADISSPTKVTLDHFGNWTEQP